MKPMKKLFSILVLSLVLFATANAQKIIISSYADTLSGAQTKYYSLSLAKGYTTYSFQAVYQHLTGSTDSAHIWFEGSIDGTNYHNISGATCASYTASPTTSFTVVTFGAATANYIWTPSSVPLPYIRVAVQHYVTGTATVKALGYPVKVSYQ
jgi:hypothetical protein